MDARSVAIATSAVIAIAGCVDGFRGSNIQIDLSGRTPVQASPGEVPGVGQVPADVHFRIYAVDAIGDREALFEVERFELHRIVDLDSPCFIDLGDNVRFPGIHVSKFGDAVAEDTGIADISMPPANATEQQMVDAATAVQRMSNVNALAGPAGIKVVTSASATVYPDVDPDCAGDGLPPPQCFDEDSNRRRLQICQQVWAADPDLFEGTDRVLTAPLNGTTFGFVIGANPISPAPVGGAQIFVDAALARMDAYAIRMHADAGDEVGEVFLTGTPVDGPRGVQHVHMESPFLPGVFTAELAVFADLGEDDVHF